MIVVGPSGLSKTDLFLKMLYNNTFFFKSEKIFFRYREMQPIYKEVGRKLEIISKKYVSLDFV